MSVSTKIRPLQKKEAVIIEKIIISNYSKKYRPIVRRDLGAVFTGKWKKPTFVVAEVGGKIIGGAGYSESWMDTTVCEIFWVNVSKKFQGRGIGTALVAALVKKITRQKYSAILLSTDKPDFYKPMGFKIIQRVPKSAYVIMSLDLK